LIETWSGFNEVHFLLLASWSRGVLIALGVALVVVLVLSAIDLRPMRPRWRPFLLLVLRLIVLCGAFAMLLEPALELRDVEREKNQIAVLLDGSQSMEVKTPLGPTRAEKGARATAQLVELYEPPTDEHQLGLYLFGKAAQSTTLGALRDRAEGAQLPETHIRESIEGLVAELGSSAIGGLILISDGIDNGRLGGRNEAQDQPLDEETVEFFRSLGFPIHVLAVATPQGLEDVAIESVLHDEFAFIRNRVTFDVHLRALGVAGKGAQVELWENGQRIRVQQVSFKSDDDRQKLAFDVVPEALGKSVYSVVVPPLDKEAIATNNLNHFVMKVIRDKTRVLQVCGRPSWDERFTRRLLKENPNFDLISFFILSTDYDLRLVSTNELSLIPFPKEELFEQELPSFDLVIFQDFDFGPYMFYRYLTNIAEFVKGGGAFLMIGGELSFSEGGYQGTPLADVLPVEMYPKGDSGGLLSTEFFRPALTDAGRRHPIAQLALDPEENRRLWEALPLLEGTNIVKGLRPGAISLLDHPQLKTAQGKPMPVVSVTEVGAGRSMAFTTDSSWLWSFEHAGRGGTSRAYSNFWNNSIRWLIKDPELKLIRVETESGKVGVREPAKVRVEVLSPDYAPARGVAGRLMVSRRPLAASWDEAEAEVLHEEDFVTDDNGAYELEVTSEVEGVAFIRAEVDRDGESQTDEDVLLVANDYEELKDIAPRNETLRQIARAAGGQYLELPVSPEALSGLTVNPPRVTRIRQRKLMTVWDSAWGFAALALFLGVEWILRRRWGRL